MNPAFVSSLFLLVDGWQWCGGGAQSWTGFLCSWGRMDGEREREFMNAPLCARFISAPTASAKSPVTPIVLEKHLKEADMGFQRV